MTATRLNGTGPDGRQAVRAVSWREERRLDRLARDQSARDGRRADADARIAQDDAGARRKREARQDRSARRSLARRRRAGRRAGVAAWFREHVTGLLFVPVIAVPGLLAWTAMAAYGRQVFGPPGVTLPAFSEGAMWAFAAAVTITRRRFPGRPVWHLLLGVAVFAGFGAVLNFAHGLSAGSVITGVVMALVSVAGVTAHQLITAGPRRSRREMGSAERVAERRQRAIRRAALRHAVAVLDADGNARLRIRPGVVAVTRRRGRIRLDPVPHSPVWLPWPMVLPGTAEPASVLRFDAQATEAVAAYQGWRSARLAPVRSFPAAPQTRPALKVAGSLNPPRSEAPQTSPAAASNGASKPAARKARKRSPSPAERRARAEQLLRDNPVISTADLVTQSGVSKATADRIRAGQASAPKE